MNKKLIILVASISTVALSQNIELTTSDSSVITIPLDNGSGGLTIDSSGNVIASTTASSEDFSSDIGGDCSATSIPPTLALTQQPDSSTIVSGGSKTIRWTIGATDADSCTKSGNGWSGSVTSSKLSIGSHEELRTNITSGANQFNMQCENNSLNSPIRTTTVGITGTTSCSTQPPILGGNEDHSPENWIDVNATGWPGASGQSIDFRFSTGKYVALGFTTSSTSLQYQFNTVSPNVLPPTLATMTISECPGDFDVHVGQAKCIVSGLSAPGILAWATDPAAPGSVFCKLEKNKQYYLNIVHAVPTGGGYGVSGCAASECSVLGAQLQVF